VYIFKRYRELNGSLPRLGRELQATGFHFEAFDHEILAQLGAEQPHVSLQQKNGVYPCTSRDALKSETGNRQGLDAANRELARLYQAREDVSRKAERIAQEQTALQKTLSLHERVIADWYTMPFERQVTYLNLIVESVTIDEISPHICKLALTFKPPIVGTLTGYLMRSHGEPIKWRDEEKEAPLAKKDVLLPGSVRPSRLLQRANSVKIWARQSGSAPRFCTSRGLLAPLSDRLRLADGQ
jgi:hypothetical protein